MHIATCGHEVKEGISCSVNDGQILSDGTHATTYGTWCAECLLGYFEDNAIASEDMNKFIDYIICWSN